MKLKISILTIILILMTIYSFVNFVGFMNGNKSTSPIFYNFERCIATEDLEDGAKVVCDYIDQTLFKHYQNMFFIFLFLTILSWRFDLLNNTKKSESNKKMPNFLF